MKPPDPIKLAAFMATAAVQVAQAAYMSAFSVCRDVFQATNETGEDRVAMNRIAEDLETLRRAMVRISREG